MLPTYLKNVHKNICNLQIRLEQFTNSTKKSYKKYWIVGNKPSINDKI